MAYTARICVGMSLELCARVYSLGVCLVNKSGVRSTGPVREHSLRDFNILSFSAYSTNGLHSR